MRIDDKTMSNVESLAKAVADGWRALVTNGVLPAASLPDLTQDELRQGIEAAITVMIVRLSED